MASYVIISSTGNIADGKRLPVEYGTWKRSKPSAEVFTGLNADTSASVGADSDKWEWEFTGLTTANGTTTDAALEGAGQTVATWFGARVVKITDVYGVTHDAVITNGFNPHETTGGINGANELFEVPMRLKQK